MSDQDAFERILTALHDATLDDALWPAASALIDDACGLHGNALAVGEGPTDAIRIISVGFYFRGHRREALEREYLTLYHPIDECVPRFRQLPDSHLVHITALYTTEELHTSPAYNEMLPRASRQDGLAVRLVEPDGAHTIWATADPVSPDSWSTPQLALIRGILPHLRQFVRVRQALVKAEARGATVPALLDTARLGVICLDQSGWVLEANDRARALLRRGDGVTDQDGGLAARIPADRAGLARLVAAALPTSSARPVSGSMRLRRAAGQPPFVVHVKPLGGGQPDYGVRRAAALVLLTAPGSPLRIDPVRVAALLGLSQVEGQLAAGLAEGRTVRELAGALGLTEGAVRWHLHEIYQKQGLSRQVDVVRLVLAVTALA